MPQLRSLADLDAGTAWSDLSEAEQAAHLAPVLESLGVNATTVNVMNVETVVVASRWRDEFRSLDATVLLTGSVAARPRSQIGQGPRRVARRSSRRNGSRASPDDPDPEPDRLARPQLTRAERDYLRSAVDRRRRFELERRAERDRLLFADEALA